MNYPSTLRSIVCLILLAALSSACGTITPGPGRDIPQLGRPILGDVALEGLVFENFRVSGYSTDIHTGTGTATTQIGYAPDAPMATTQVNTTHVTTTDHWERYDDDSIQVALRYALEDNRVVRRFTPDARLRIVGRRVSGGASTGPGKVAWNVLNGITLLGLLPGLPFLGDQEAEVELRVYFDDALVRSYRGHGSASWTKNMWGVVPALGPLRRGSLNAASAVAARNAVVALIEDPPRLPSHD